GRRMSSGRMRLRYVIAARLRALMSLCVPDVQTAPLFISSGDLIADRRYGWAIAYLARGDRAGAAEILGQVLETAPAFAGAWFALGAIREAEGDRERAIAAFG